MVQKNVHTLLIASTIMVGFISEWLVSTLDVFTTQFGMSELFIGAFIIAIIGNAAEHSAAVILAMKNKMSAAVEIAIGSSLQIAMFVAPVIIITSFFHGANDEYCIYNFRVNCNRCSGVYSKFHFTRWADQLVRRSNAANGVYHPRCYILSRIVLLAPSHSRYTANKQSSRRGRLAPVLSHHRTYRSVYGGSCHIPQGFVSVH